MHLISNSSHIAMTTFIVVTITGLIVKRHLRRRRRVPRLSTECPHKCSLLTKGENKGTDDVFVAPTLLALYLSKRKRAGKIFTLKFNPTLNDLKEDQLTGFLCWLVSISCYNKKKKEGSLCVTERHPPPHHKCFLPMLGNTHQPRKMHDSH